MKAKPLDLPTSGPLLRALAHDLDLFAHNADLSHRTVRRYFEGARVSAEGSRSAHAAVARAVIESDLLPTALRELVVDGENMPLAARANMVGHFIGAYASSWEALAKLLRQGPPVAYPRPAMAAALRLLAIDLATRLGAVLWLLEWPKDHRIPRWFLAPNGPGAYLRDQLKRQEVTRAGFADVVGVNEKTVDPWLDDSTRPNRDHLLRLSHHLELIAPTRPNANSGTGLRATLFLGYGARALFQRCAGVVGEREAYELFERTLSNAERVCAFVRLSRHGHDVVRQMMLGTLLCGTSRPAATPWVPFVLRHLHRSEPDPVWRTALRAGAQWDAHLLRVAAKLGPITEASRGELARLFGAEPTGDDLERLQRLILADQEELAANPLFANAVDSLVSQGGEAAGTNLRIQAAEVPLSDPLRAIELLRHAIEANPTDAEAHFRLGARLGQLGDVESSLAELRIAVALRPEWDRPRVEIAIVLGNEGQHEAALEELRKSQIELTEVTPWVKLHVAFELEQLDRWEEALAAYETYLEEQPLDAEALDRAAHLYLVLGKRVPARQRAKQAAMHGISTVLDALESGHYSAREAPTRRPPHRPGLNVHFRPFRDREPSPLDGG